MKFIAMIPGRLGSKRVIKKNIRYLCGKPLIQYAIDAAKNCGRFEEIWVNTESEIIGRLALQCGVKFHLRPSWLSSDTATNQDFTAEFLRSHKCDYVVMVNPTSPLLKAETIGRFCDYVEKNEFDTVLSVIEEQAECFYNGKPVNFSTKEKVNSQALIAVEKVIWAMTAWRRKHFLDLDESGKCGVFAGRLGRFSIPLHESCDIDTQEEWDLAEVMLIERSKKENEKYGKTNGPIYWRETYEHG